MTAEDELLLRRFITWRCPECAGVFKVEPMNELDYCLVELVRNQRCCSFCEEFTKGPGADLVKVCAYQASELPDAEAQE